MEYIDKLKLGNWFTDQVKEKENLKRADYVWLPNPYVWAPIEGWNSLFKETTKKPLISATNNQEWYKFFQFKLLIDNYFKFKWQNISTWYNSDVLSYLDPDKHCYWQFAIKFKPINCGKTTSCTPFIFKPNSLSVLNKDIKKFNNKLEYTIDTNQEFEYYEICQDKEIKLNNLQEAIKKYYDYIVWYVLSTPVSYANNPDDFSKVKKKNH